MKVSSNKKDLARASSRLQTPLPLSLTTNTSLEGWIPPLCLVQSSQTTSTVPRVLAANGNALVLNYPPLPISLQVLTLVNSHVPSQWAHQTTNQTANRGNPLTTLPTPPPYNPVSIPTSAQPMVPTFPSCPKHPQFQTHLVASAVAPPLTTKNTNCPSTNTIQPPQTTTPQAAVHHPAHHRPHAPAQMAISEKQMPQAKKAPTYFSTSPRPPPWPSPQTGTTHESTHPPRHPRTQLSHHQ